MAYDSAGKTYNLETAGMFDIRGSQNGEPVYIKPEKNLEVELASATSEQRFNQYYLDTLKRNWEYIKKDNALAVPEKKAQTAVTVPVVTNPKLETLKTQIEKTIPKKIDSVKVVYTTKAEKLPKPKEPVKPVKTTPGKPTFVLDGSYNDFPELAAFDNVIFEVGAENKNYTKDLHDVTWSDIKVSQGPVKGKNYILNLIYRNRSEKLIVYPVLSAEDFEKAEKQYDQKLENYQLLVDKRLQEEKRLMAEMQAKQASYMAEQEKKQKEYEAEKAAMRAKYNMAEQNDLASNFNAMSIQVKASRLFQVSKFGIFNSDCPHVSPQGNSVVPIFVTNENQKLVSPDFIYLIDHSHKTVYILDKSSRFKLSYLPENSYSICIFHENRMFICNKAVFKQTVDLDGKIFTVESLPENADNLAGFKKAIEI